MSSKLVYRRHDRFGPVRTPGGALRDCRLALNLNQHAFARHIFVSTRTLSRWEFDDHLPPMSERERVLTYVLNAPPLLVRTLANAWSVPVPPEAMPPAPAPQETVSPLEAAFFTSAEQHDVSPRRLRAATIQVLRAIERLGLTPSAAREQLSRASPAAP